MIPKIIHYCWFGGDPIPNELKKYMRSWKKYCPDYHIKKWDESNFDVNSHPFVSVAYKAKAWAFVSDYVRLNVIYNYGGIYLDTDIEIIKKIDFLLAHDFFIGIQQKGKCDQAYATTGLGFGAVKHHEVVKKMMAEYDDLDFDDEMKEKFACPILNTNVLREYGYKFSESVQNYNGIVVYPSEYFDPCSPGSDRILMTDNTVFIHHYSATWMDKKTRFRRKIINSIGIEQIEKIKALLHRKG